MRFIIKIFIALVALLLIYGIHGMYVWFAEREPVRMSCREFFALRDKPRWVVLSDCQVNWNETVRGYGDDGYYVPVRPRNTIGTTSLVMEVRAPAHLARAQAALASPVAGRDLYVGEVAGLTGSEMFLGRRGRRAITNGGDVASGFDVLRQDARPEIVWPALSTLGGLALIVGTWKIARWARRPKPAEPTHVGPIPPPEQIIAHTRQVAGDAPRKIARFGGLVWPMPPWLDADAKDPLRAIYDDQAKLLVEGRIVWACIVQANQSLFAAGTDDAPAAILYSTDPYFDAHPEELAELAEGLFSIKGEAADPELMNFSRILADEVTRAMRLEVPRRFTGGREVIYTSIVVRRVDLPDGFLADGMFPLLVLPGETSSTLMVPWEWWPPALVAMWRMPRPPAMPPPLPPPSGGVPLPMPPLAPPPLR